MLVPRGIDAESHHDTVVSEVDAIKQEDLQVELAQRLTQPLAELLLGERYETTGDCTLRRGACSLALGQPVKAPGITAARHPGRHGRERLTIERVTIFNWMYFAWELLPLAFRPFELLTPLFIGIELLFSRPLRRFGGHCCLLARKPGPELFPREDWFE